MHEKGERRIKRHLWVAPLAVLFKPAFWVQAGFSHDTSFSEPPPPPCRTPALAALLISRLASLFLLTCVISEAKLPLVFMISAWKERNRKVLFSQDFFRGREAWNLLLPYLSSRPQLGTILGPGGLLPFMRVKIIVSHDWLYLWCTEKKVKISCCTLGRKILCNWSWLAGVLVPVSPYHRQAILASGKPRTAIFDGHANPALRTAKTGSLWHDATMTLFQRLSSPSCY